MGMKTDQKTFSFSVGILLFFVLFTVGYAENSNNEHSPESQKLRELFISTSIKSIAKAYIAVTDLDKLKQTNINKIRKMEDREFRVKYTKIYIDLKDMPKNVKDAYGLSDTMDKTTAIKKIESVEKKDLYIIIDSIPDIYIVRHFDDYLAERKLDMRRSFSKREIKRFWQDIKKKIEIE